MWSDTGKELRLKLNVCPSLPGPRGPGDPLNHRLLRHHPSWRNLVHLPSVWAAGHLDMSTVSWEVHLEDKAWNVLTVTNPVEGRSEWQVIKVHGTIHRTHSQEPIIWTEPVDHREPFSGWNFCYVFDINQHMKDVQTTAPTSLLDNILIFTTSVIVLVLKNAPPLFLKCTQRSLLLFCLFSSVLTKCLCPMECPNT